MVLHTTGTKMLSLCLCVLLSVYTCLSCAPLFPPPLCASNLVLTSTSMRLSPVTSVGLKGATRADATLTPAGSRMCAARRSTVLV